MSWSEIPSVELYYAEGRKNLLLSLYKSNMVSMFPSAFTKGSR